MSLDLVNSQVSAPITGSAFSDLLRRVLPNYCSIEGTKRLLQSRIGEERQEFMENIFQGLKNSWNQINVTNELDSFQTMYGFYVEVHNVQDHFTTHHLDEAVIFYRHYATLKIALIKLLKQLRPPEETIMDELLRTDAKILVEAGEKMIIQVPKIMEAKEQQDRKPPLWRRAEIRQNVKKLLVKSLKVWRSFYGAQTPNMKIKDWNVVGFRIVNWQVTYDQWVSCLGSGSTCRPRACPGRNGASYPSDL